MRQCSIVLAAMAGALVLSAQVQVNDPGAASVAAAGTVFRQAWAGAWAHAWEDQNPVHETAAEQPAAPGTPQTRPERPKAITYSNAYYTRLKIHRYASYATLPLFVSEVIVGQKLYNSPGTRGSLRSAHSALAAGIAGLFGVNTVTGLWNMHDMRDDPNGRRRRRIHEILMLAADGGFLATAALAPSHERGGLTVDTSGRATHRAVALTSIGIATAGYVYMLMTR